MSLTVEKCLQAWSNSLKQMNAKADIVFFGDSLTYYGDFSSVFPDKVVCNLGLRGDTIQGMIDRVEQVKILEPKMVFLMAGINDLSTCSRTQFKANYEALIQEILDLVPTVRLFIQSILPVNDKAFPISCNNDMIIEYNSEIINITKHYGLNYLDLYSIYEEEGVLALDNTLDGLHLKSQSYEKWYDELKKYSIIFDTLYS